jgi:olefin beta-lactone synthetase
MNLVTLLLDQASRYPQRLAIIDQQSGQDRTVTYAELASRVAAGAAALTAMGLKRGQAILVFQPISIELYEILLAAFHNGLTVMLADPSAGNKFLELCCKRLLPSAFFGTWKAQFLRLMIPEIRWLKPAIRTSGWFPLTQSWTTNIGSVPLTEVANDEPALISFTSGSTGIPKAAVRTHGFLLAQHHALSRAMELSEGQVDLITLPVFVLANLASGLTSVLAATDLAKPASPSAAAIMQQCQKFGVTRCAASPAFFEGLLKSPAGLPSLQKVFTGGAPVFPDLLQRIKLELPRALIHSVYGSTEAEPIAHFSACEANEETAKITSNGGGLCTGQPISEIDLKIISDLWGQPLGPLTDQALATLEVEPGQIGEIIVSGSHVLPGYLDGIGDDVSKIHSTTKIWHRTGDAGWMDPAGRLWLVGRCAEKLAPTRTQLSLPESALQYSFAIECSLREFFPNVRLAALNSNGKRLLVVETGSGSTINDGICSRSLALGMDEVVEIKAIPMDRRHQAKIDYPALRVLLSNTSLARKILGDVSAR